MQTKEECIEEGRIGEDEVAKRKGEYALLGRERERGGGGGYTHANDSTYPIYLYLFRLFDVNLETLILITWYHQKAYVCVLQYISSCYLAS